MGGVAPDRDQFPIGRLIAWVSRQDRETACAGHRLAPRSFAMMDVLMLAMGFVFFALAIGYTYACERL
jgi:hypothetical protein